LRVKVRLGGSLPQMTGRPVEQALELPEGATVAEALAAAGVGQGLAMLVSVDGQLRPPTEVLSEGNHLIVVPPVSGGA
jgi:sulfur carrier protein ThiS